MCFDLNVTFKDAFPHEAELLSALALCSKGHWGYSKEQLDLWRDDLRITSEYIIENTVRTIWLASEQIGFFAISTKKENELEHLWLLPHAIGRGVGALTFREIERVCRYLDIKILTIVSDPNAEGFYLHQGAQRIGEIESIQQNRFLPKLSYRIP